MSLKVNLLPRFRLIWAALTKRFIYDDALAVAETAGIPYRDLCADTEPFSFVRSALGGKSGLPEAPDFSRLVDSEDKFTPADAPAIFNSEPSVARFLGQLVFHKEARVVVELGCFVGWTTAHMAAALQASGAGGRLFAVDFSPAYLKTMQSNLRRNGGLDRLVTPVQGLSLDKAVLAALPPQIDVLFLDTGHDYPDTRDEILAYAPRLSAGGFIVLHDSIGAPGVRRSVGELLDRFHALTFSTERSNGVTVLWPKARTA